MRNLKGPWCPVLACCLLSCLYLILGAGSPTGLIQGAEPQVMDGGSMPEILYSSYSEIPRFVSIHNILDPFGRMNRDLLPPANTFSFEQILEHSGEECAERIRAHEYGNRSENLEQAFQDKTLIFVGKVTGLVEGLHVGRLGTLIRVDVTETLRGQPWSLTNYLFFPAADFQIGSQRICVFSPDYPLVPELGDQLFIATGDSPSLRNLPVLPAALDVLLVFRGNQTLARRHLRFIDRSITKDQFIAQMRQIFEGQNQ